MIRTRLIFWNAVIFAVALTLIGGIVFVTTRTGLYRNVDHDLALRAEFLTNGWRSRGGPFNGGPPPNGFGGGFRDGDHHHDGPHDHPGDGRFGPGDRGPGGGPPTPGGPFGEQALKTLRQIDPIEAERVAFSERLVMPKIFGPENEPMGRHSDIPFDKALLLRSLKGSTEYQNVNIDGHRIRVLSLPLMRYGKPSAAAQFAASLDQVDDSIARLGKTLLALLPLALIATSCLGVWLTKRALRPVQAIAEAAERIEATNLSERLPVSGADEFALLSGRFNSMLSRIEESFSRLEKAYEAQRRFIADASHELKTPLTTIKGRVGVSQVGAQTPERYAEHMKSIGRAADTMNSIITDLLLLARSDEDQIVLRKAPCNLHDLGTDAAAAVSPPNSNRIKIEMPEDLVIDADGALLYRVFLNLLSNAVRHTPEDKGIRLVGRRFGDRVIVEVIDQGEGIPADHLGLIFERFHRVDVSRDRASGGTGLGLSIARSIVLAHGGEIEIESELGKGTTARITL